ncbi:hypothetical protein [Rhodoblastus sp.]|uniref:hypothetical protein n=1 Tax=Rhodoblastus sp. TaxID=1962975 RepID=UPI0035B4DC0F
MKPSSLCFKAGVLFVVVGMAWGLLMGASGDHSTLAAHAHFNLLGFVSLFLFGFYYRLNPLVEAQSLARTHVWIWIAGTLVLSIGVALVHTDHPIGDPFAALGSIVILLDAILFAWLVLRAPEGESLA